MKKRLLPALLALVLALGLLPMSALAVEEPSGTAPETGETSAIKLTVTPLTDGNTAEISEDGNTITVNPVTTLKWFAKDEEIGRNSDGWWVGIKMALPSDTTEENMKKIKYKNSDSATTLKSLEEHLDGKTQGDYYMTAWGAITEEHLETIQGMLGTTASNGTVWEKVGMTYTWRFWWNPTDENPSNDSADQIIKLTFVVDPKTTKLMKEDKLFWPELTVEAEKTADGKPTVKDEIMAGAIAAAETDESKTATVEVTAAEDGATSVELGKAAFKAASESKEDALKLAIKAGDVATVTFDKTAIGAINTAASDDAKVTISVENVTESAEVDIQKPEDAVAAYEVKVTAGDGGSVTWGDSSKITLTVPAPTDGDGKNVDVGKLMVYLDGELEETIKTTANDDSKTINVTVPHLTVVSLGVDKRSGFTITKDDSADSSRYYPVKISGLAEDHYYTVRIADSAAKATNSIIIPITGKTDFSFSCTYGRFVTVNEYESEKSYSDQLQAGQATEVQYLDQKTLTCAAD